MLCGSCWSGMVGFYERWDVWDVVVYEGLEGLDWHAMVYPGVDDGRETCMWKILMSAGGWRVDWKTG